MNLESSRATALRGMARWSKRPQPSFGSGRQGGGEPCLESGHAELLVRCLDVPLLFMDTTGHACWRNSAAGRLVETDPVTWYRALTAAAAAILRQMPTGDLAMRSVGMVRVGDAKYVVRGCALPVRAGHALAALHLQRVCLVRRAPAVLRDRCGLTVQETRVATLMAGGYSDAEIGRRLGISPHTARSHAERVRRKLQVRSRAQVNRVLLVEWTGEQEV